MNKKYVITGGPGTGKTSIINELRKRGFYCINENSRNIISEQIKNGGDILPWKDQISFENQITKIRTNDYLSSPKDSVCFFDRSSIDSIAYLKISNIDVPSEIIELTQQCSFNKNIFYTPIWKEIYKNDKERKESIEFANKIEKAIIETYKSKGYNLIKIPKLSIKKRADFIISKI